MRALHLTLNHIWLAEVIRISAALGQRRNCKRLQPTSFLFIILIFWAAEKKKPNLVSNITFIFFLTRVRGKLISLERYIFILEPAWKWRSIFCNVFLNLIVLLAREKVGKKKIYLDTVGRPTHTLGLFVWCLAESMHQYHFKGTFKVWTYSTRSQTKPIFFVCLLQGL